MFELLENYGTDTNHSGPYQTFAASKDAANHRIGHNRSMRAIYVIPRDKRVLDRNNAIYEISRYERDGATHYMHRIMNFEHGIKEVRRGMFGVASGQGVGGYGSRISTDHVIKFNKRTYRVYCMCYSNVGSLYIRMGKDRVFVRESDLER